MKKTIKTIGITVVIGIMLVSAYLLGTMQAETVTEIQAMTGTGIKEVAPDAHIMDAAVFQDNQDDCVDVRKVVGYELSSDGLQLYFEDGSGYWLGR